MNVSNLSVRYLIQNQSCSLMALKEESAEFSICHEFTTLCLIDMLVAPEEQSEVGRIYQECLSRKISAIHQIVAQTFSLEQRNGQNNSLSVQNPEVAIDRLQRAQCVCTEILHIGKHLPVFQPIFFFNETTST